MKTIYIYLWIKYFFLHVKHIFQPILKWEYIKWYK